MFIISTSSGVMAALRFSIPAFFSFSFHICTLTEIFSAMRKFPINFLVLLSVVPIVCLFLSESFGSRSHGCKKVDVNFVKEI